MWDYKTQINYQIESWEPLSQNTSNPLIIPSKDEHVTKRNKTEGNMAMQFIANLLVGKSVKITLPTLHLDTQC